MTFALTRRHRRSLNYGVLLLAVFGLIALAIPQQFLGRTNLQSMAFQCPEFGVLSLGMMIVVITGGIDLSIVANANLSGIVAASAMLGLLRSGHGAHAWCALPLMCVTAIAVGALAGLFNGLLVARVGISPILATLGSMKLFEGLATVLSGGRPITGFPDEVQFVANGTLGAVPISALVFLVAAVMVNTVLRHTPLGFTTYMLGANPIASKYAGVNNSSVLTRTYAIAGALAGLAAILMMSRFNSVKVGYGNSYLLQTVLVVILGGVDPDGGEGDVLSVVFAILTLQCIASGFNLLGFSNYVRNVIYGGMLVLVLVAAVMTPRIMAALRQRSTRSAGVPVDGSGAAAGGAR